LNAENEGLARLMKRSLALLSMFSLILAAGFLTSPVAAHEGHDDATAATPTGSAVASNTGTGLVYLEIRNDGDEPDRLLAANTDAAQSVDLHGSEIDDGVMRMTSLSDGLEIPAGESIVLEPQGMHLMLVNLNHDLRPGDTYQVTLTFEHAGEITIDVTVAVDAPEEEAGTTVGNLTIESAWSLPAPRLTPAPAASPEATPHH
jgi:copper(I)-binding protein